MENIQELNGKEIRELNDEVIDSDMSSLKERTDWFAGVEDINGRRHYYQKEEVDESLKKSIVEGKYQKDSKVIIYTKSKEEKWEETTSSLLEFSKSYFGLRTLYQPVWAHAITGLKWGAVIGIALKLLDTTIFLGAVDPGLAFLFLVAVGVCFIPRIGFGAVIVVSILMMKYTRANLFLMGIAAAVVGSVLGCLPGMFIGGIIGYVRRDYYPVPDNNNHEPDNLFAKAILMPLLGGCGIFAFYLFIFNPWLMSVLN